MDKDKKAAELLKRAYNLKSEEETRTLYRDWADSYDKTMLEGLRYTTPRKTAELLCNYLADGQACILDVGSGTGLAGLELQRLGFTNVHALDYSPEMLAEAESRGVYTKLVEAALNRSLNIDTCTYDAMICTGTFTHAHVGAACLHELFRILKPEGFFACTVHFEVWKPAGFGEAVTRLENLRFIKTVYKQPGTFFETSSEDDGWFIVWQKSG